MISTNKGRMNGTWDISNVNSDFEFTIKSGSNFLDEGKNDLGVTLTYYDERGNVYVREKDFNVTLQPLTFFEKIDRFFKRLFG